MLKRELRGDTGDGLLALFIFTMSVIIFSAQRARFSSPASREGALLRSASTCTFRSQHHWKKTQEERGGSAPKSALTPLLDQSSSLVLYRA